jgi:hypothetical protein
VVINRLVAVVLNIIRQYCTGQLQDIGRFEDFAAVIAFFFGIGVIPGAV